MPYQSNSHELIPERPLPHDQFQEFDSSRALHDRPYWTAEPTTTSLSMRGSAKRSSACRACELSPSSSSGATSSETQAAEPSAKAMAMAKLVRFIMSPVKFVTSLIQMTCHHVTSGRNCPHGFDRVTTMNRFVQNLRRLRSGLNTKLS